MAAWKQQNCKYYNTPVIKNELIEMVPLIFSAASCQHKMLWAKAIIMPSVCFHGMSGTLEYDKKKAYSNSDTDLI